MVLDTTACFIDVAKIILDHNKTVSSSALRSNPEEVRDEFRLTLCIITA
jgi:hypothetical protein